MSLKYICFLKSSQQTYEVSIIISILWVDNLRWREVKQYTQGHSAMKCGVKVLNWVLLTSRAHLNHYILLPRI